jgi:hypothetical protein
MGFAEMEENHAADHVTFGVIGVFFQRVVLGFQSLRKIALQRVGPGDIVGRPGVGGRIQALLFEVLQRFVVILLRPVIGAPI